MHACVSCLLSILRTLEQKKRAMVQAEEERRRKALEDRKKVQVEATQKFKSAINRLKSMPYSDESEFLSFLPSSPFSL